MTELLLAVDVDGDGAHPAAWRHSGRAPGAVLGARALLEVTAAADQAGFALASFADSPLPPSAPPELPPPPPEPFPLAPQLASLDYASHGRAAWVVGAARSAEALATVGAAPLSAAAARQEVADVIDVGRGLWDSWGDDAVIKG